ncbi:hypothetical protein BDQ17DRAFT_1401892 [Cyathus striatus]|nr:hypothetical protein BDQ17DRAFT_1401892 [Cyathus striatus]
MPQELESTLTMLSSHRSVLGYLLITRGHPYAIIRQAVARMVEHVQNGLEEVRNDDGDDIRFMRIRTKRHEIMISPDERYILAVLHDPAT